MSSAGSPLTGSSPAWAAQPGPGPATPVPACVLSRKLTWTARLPPASSTARNTPTIRSTVSRCTSRAAIPHTGATLAVRGRSRRRSKSGTLGSGITNPVYFVEFTASESTNYTTSGGGSLAFRAGQSTNYNGLGLGNCIKVPTGIVNGDVVLAAISWSDGTSEAITTPANYALNLTPSDLGGGTAYVLRSTNSDLSGGLDFNRELNPGTETAGSIAVSVAAGATEDSFGFTRAGQPGVSGITGNYIVEMNVTVANANILLSTAVARVNSVGVLQTLSGFSAEQSAGSTGVKTFSLTSVNLGTWSSGDRLKVYYRFRNTAASAQSVTLQTGTTSAEAMAPWTIGDFNKELGDFSTDISLAVSVAASATEDSFGFTPSGVPGAIGVTGDYWLSNYVTAAT